MANYRNSLVKLILTTARKIENQGNNLLRTRGVNLTVTQLNILRLTPPEGVSQQELSDQCVIGRSAISITVARMEKDGILLTGQGKDKRSKKVTLTKHGLALRNKAEHAYQELLLERLGTVSEKDTITVRDILAKIKFTPDLEA